MSDSSGISSDRYGIQIVNLALAENLINTDQWTEALGVQSREFASGRWVRSLTAILLSLGHIQQDQVNALRARIDASLRRFDQGLSEPTPPTHKIEGPLPPAKAAFGTYQLIREIGRGSRGSVYEAVDSRDRKRIAIKLIPHAPESTPDQHVREEQWFLREAMRMRELPRHPHLVEVLETGAFQGTRFVAMEWIDGQPLHCWWNTPASQPHRVHVLRDVARAVHLAHRKGMVHGSLKPADILVDAQNRPHVTDFGISRSVRRDPRAAASLGSRFMSSLVYLSPEQAREAKIVDARSDVYSLGVMLYEVMTGQSPFEGHSPIQAVMKAVSGEVPRPSSVRPTTSAAEAEMALERICLRAMARHPEDRYPTVEALAEDLTLWLRGKKPSVCRAGGSRRPLVLGSAAAAALLAIGAGVFLLRPSEPPPISAPPPPVARPAEPAGGPRDLPGLKFLAKNPQGFAEYRNLNDTSTMVLIPGGAFLMGNAKGMNNEKPELKVHLDAYLIDKTEVTVGQFRRFVEATGHVTEAEMKGWAHVFKAGGPVRQNGASWRAPGYPQEETHPVTCISWNDAAEYCRWSGKRLPTEAEWEKAARGTEGRIWPWGDEWDGTRANAELRFNGTLPAGSFPEAASPFGLLDLAGSLTEHCADWFHETYFQVGEVRNPRGPLEGKWRVLKGGSWVDTGYLCRSTRRFGSYPEPWGVSNADGFRGAATPPEPPPPVERSSTGN